MTPAQHRRAIRSWFADVLRLVCGGLTWYVLAAVALVILGSLN